MTETHAIYSCRSNYWVKIIILCEIHQMVICPVRGTYNRVQKWDVKSLKNEFSFQAMSKPAISTMCAIIQCPHLSQNSIVFPRNVKYLHGSSDEELFNHV